MMRRAILALVAGGALALVACATPGSNISEVDYRILSNVMKAMDRKDFDEARRALAPLLSSPSAYTKGIAYQTLAYVEAREDHPDAAIAAYHAALATGALKPEVQHQMLLNIALLANRAENCAEAIPAFEQWHAATGKPYDRAAAASLAVCHADQGRFDEAAGLYASASQSIKEPTAAWRKIGSDLALARQGTRFPERHFIRTLNDDTYFGTRPARRDGDCRLEEPSGHGGVDGSVTVTFTVDAAGVPSAARVSKSDLPEAWKTAAVEAVLKCKWVPALEGGKPVKSETTMTWSAK